MRIYTVFSIFTILTIYCVNVSASKSKPYYDLKNSRSLFNDFKKKFKRNYASIYQEQERFKVFTDNLQRINAANANPALKQYQEIGPFSDMSPPEFVKFQNAMRNKPGSLDYGWRRTDRDNEKGIQKIFKGW